MPVTQFTLDRTNFPDPILSVKADGTDSNITFYGGPAEMLRVTEDGFYVRGEKVPVDDNEGAVVYKAFKEFLVHHALTRSY
jgi:hypothetical protein